MPAPDAPRITTSRGTLVEAAVESAAAAGDATAAGADRLELCQDLDVGGTTPSARFIAAARERVRVPVHVLIRPRAGDSCYEPGELEAMLEDLDMARHQGASGVVVGALRPNREIDLEAMRRLLQAAGPLPVTFHRAFDSAVDPFRALDDLIGLGVHRVLTSGQASTAEAGIPVLADLVKRADGRIIVLAGGGIRPGHARRIVEETGVSEIHLRHGPWLRGVVAEIRS